MRVLLSNDDKRKVLDICADAIDLSGDMLVKKFAGSRSERVVRAKAAAVTIFEKYWTARVQPIADLMNLHRSSIMNLQKVHKDYMNTESDKSAVYKKILSKAEERCLAEIEILHTNFYPHERRED